MKVLDSSIQSDGYVWFKVKLDRNTDILLQELFTQANIDEAKKEAIKEFMNKIIENNS